MGPLFKDIIHRPGFNPNWLDINYVYQMPAIQEACISGNFEIVPILLWDLRVNVWIDKLTINGKQSAALTHISGTVFGYTFTGEKTLGTMAGMIELQGATIHHREYKTSVGWSGGWQSGEILVDELEITIFTAKGEEFVIKPDYGCILPKYLLKLFHFLSNCKGKSNT